MVAATCAVMFLASSEVLAQDGGELPSTKTNVSPGTSPVNPASPTNPAPPAQQPANLPSTTPTTRLGKKEGEPDPDDKKVGGDGGVPPTKKVVPSPAGDPKVEGDVIEVIESPKDLIDTLKANAAERQSSAESAEKIGELNKKLDDLQEKVKAEQVKANDLQEKVRAEQVKAEGVELKHAEEIAKLEGMIAASDADAEKWSGKYINLVKSGGDAYKVEVLKVAVATLEDDKIALRVKIAAIEAESLEKLDETKVALGVAVVALAETQTALFEANEAKATFETKFYAVRGRGFWSRLFNTEPEVGGE